MEESIKKHKFNGELGEIWEGLTPDQRAYVVARLDYPTKKDAAFHIGLKPQTIYQWPKEVERAYDLLKEDILLGAVDIIRVSLAKAAMIKVSGLDSDDERIKQAVATEILDREMGKPTQRNEHTGGDGGPIIVVNWDGVMGDDGTD